MMNVMFVLIARKAFSNVMEGINSKAFFTYSAHVFNMYNLLIPLVDSFCHLQFLTHLGGN